MEFFLIFHFILDIIDKQCCVGFRCTAKLFRYTYICVYPFSHSFPNRLLQNIEQSVLCYTGDPSWLFILNIIVCICQSQTPNLSLPVKKQWKF